MPSLLGFRLHCPGSFGLSYDRCVNHYQPGRFSFPLSIGRAHLRNSFFPAPQRDFDFGAFTGVFEKREFLSDKIFALRLEKSAGGFVHEPNHIRFINDDNSMAAAFDNVREAGPAVLRHLVGFGACPNSH